MQACRDAGLQFMVTDKVSVSVMVSDGIRVSTFYFLSC